MFTFNKKLFFLILGFWIFSFYVGFTYANNLDSIFGASKEQITAEYQKSSLGNTNTQLYPIINQLDPTELEVLSLETYATNISDQNVLAIDTSMNHLITCQLLEKGTVYEVDEPYDLLVILNKAHKLKTPFQPNDLVLVSDYEIPTTATVYLRRQVAEQLQKMYKDMSQANLKIAVSSGWRSLEHQQRVLQNWTRMVGANNANMYAALPGFSEHHLGTAVDILTAENGYTISPAYFNTRTFKWLAENSYKYGFMLSYPQGKEAITGYNPEGWHYRFVGVENATTIYTQKTTLAEYLQKYNNICP